MPETWTGDLIGAMHNKKITRKDLAEELGVTKAYVTMILNGQRNPPKIQSRMENAFAAIVARTRK